ncbi:diheme cytochrome c-553 [Solitalea longa]|uniref:Diheme cytochrome c-553 n=1 Tax=Solitalea longa TaxID=2079460 RepID=A0A2S5A607_9SPHI|nr:cytochrome c [Solitalea longa]POY38031.1 diheme cytochrome c-553 [Solitalea longa]
MKNNLKKRSYLLILVCIGGLELMTYCSSQPKQQEETPTKEQQIERGRYLVTAGSCNDCHSPKIFTEQGPIVDSTKLLSGHPAGSKLPPIDPKSTSPADWIHMSQDATAFIGPWGLSYAANLTPDETTGLGAWTEEVFIKTLRTGKHLGLDTGRPIMPPMPWFFIGKLNDEDLKAVFAYLKSIPAVNNQVPAPVAPPEVAKMVTSN